ncbi:MAG: alpha/beta hydrolase fold domain-containing protein [Planctomycetaceae bacterium]
MKARPFARLHLFVVAVLIASPQVEAQQRELTPQQKRSRAVRQKLKAIGVKPQRAKVLKPDGIETRLDVVYAKYGDRELHLDLLMPRKRSKQTAAIVVVHGGAWHKGDRQSFHALAENFAMRGYVTAAIEYRLADEAKFPAAVHDCNAATRWLRANAAELQIDPNRIAAVGGSAGGHLVGLMGAAAGVKELQGDGGNPNQSSELRAVAVLAGPMQMTTGSVADRSRKVPNESNSNRWIGKSIDEAPELYSLAAPFKHLSAKTPPMIFLAGEYDKPSRNQPTRAKLSAFGVPTAVRSYSFGLHACWNQTPWMQPMAADIDDFFRSVLGDPGGERQPFQIDAAGEVLAFHDRVEVAIGKLEKQTKIEIPRLNNPIGKVYIKGTDTEVPLKPLLTTWELKVPVAASDKGIVVETIGQPDLPVLPRVVSANADGTVTLPAHEAVTHGKLLRYEPQPHKNTVGYWANPKDWVEWHFYCEKPGDYALHILQGCGKGHGGSEVDVKIGKQVVSFVVEDTGHFQNFKDRETGLFTIEKPGVYNLQVRAKKKAKVAVMDVRQVRLVPQ